MGAYPSSLNIVTCYLDLDNRVRSWTLVEFADDLTLIVNDQHAAMVETNTNTAINTIV